MEMLIKEGSYMFGKAGEISISIRLYSGLHHEISDPDYDPYTGKTLVIRNGTRLRTVIAGLGIRNPSTNAYFAGGKRIGLWTKLRDGDDITCIKPSAGG
jgi:hypothetical protein